MWVCFFTTIRLFEKRISCKGDMWHDLRRGLHTGMIGQAAAAGALGRAGIQARPAGPWSPLQATPSPKKYFSLFFIVRVIYIYNTICISN